MAKTAAERQRQYRARRNTDAERRETYLRSERERWKRDRQGKRKKKAIWVTELNDISERCGGMLKKDRRRGKL